MEKTKNKKILIVLGIALAAAIVAGALIYLFLAPQRTTIYVFRDNYEAGTKLDTSMLAPLQVDSNVILAGASTDTSSHFITSQTYSSAVQNGDLLRVNVLKGEPLMVTNLSSVGNNSIEARMDETSIAVTVPVDNITGVTPGIKAESHINIYSNVNGTTNLILQNMRVLGVHTENNAICGVTVETNNDEAIKLVNAIGSGNIYCGLTNGNGYVYVNSNKGE